MKLHLIVNSTPIEAVICVLEDTRRSIVSQNQEEPGVPVVTLAMGNTGHVPVCRGLVSETTQQHAAVKLDFRVDSFHAHRHTGGALASISALHAHSSAPHNGKVDPFVWPRDSASWC